MEREAFLSLSITEQIGHFNNELKKGSSITKISKEIGISKSITEKFKNYGYKFEDNQFKGEDIKASKSIKAKETKLQQPNAVVKEKLDEPIVKNNIGRPKKSNSENSSKHNITMDSVLWKTLRIYAIQNDTEASTIIEELVKKFIKNNI